MSTGGTAGRRVGFGLVFLVIFWPLFGFVGDIGARRRDPSQETVTATMAAWTSTIFHVGGAAVVAFVNPLLGIAWGLFAAGVLSRRLGARRGLGVPMTAWASDRSSLIALATCGVLPLLWALTNDGVLKTFAALGVVAGLTIVGVSALKWTSAAVDSAQVYDRWVLDLAAPFGVSQQVFDDAGLQSNGEGVVIDPVPAPIAVRYEFNAFDAALATVHPHLEISPESTSQRIIIQTASDETRARRTSLASSGGLIAGIGTAPIAAAPQGRHAEMPAYHQTEGEPLVISLEDL
jgi:hypothetical protein